MELVEEFIRFKYITGSEVAWRDEERTAYSCLSGQSRPRSAERINVPLDSIPAETDAGAHRLRNTDTICRRRNGRDPDRFVVKLRRDPEASGWIQGICPNCGASGPKRERRDEALRAWNGKG